MTRKKYVITFVIFALLLILSLFLFFAGLFLKDNNENVFYIFVVGSCFSFISAIVLIAINYQKLVAFDVKKINKKINNLDFTVMDMPISKSELCDKLIKFGYIYKNEIFHKVVEDNCGDGCVVSHYYVTIHQADGSIDIQSTLERFDKGMTTYNIAYIFLDNNVDENIAKIRDYIRQSILDVKVHTYKYKKFFVPIILAHNKVYYIKESGIFMDTYGFGVVEGLHILNDSH